MIVIADREELKWIFFIVQLLFVKHHYLITTMDIIWPKRIPILQVIPQEPRESWVTTVCMHAKLLQLCPTLRP